MAIKTLSTESILRPRLKFTRAHFDFAGIAFGIVIAVAYPLMTAYGAVDFEKYLMAARNGNYTHFFYAQWIIPFFIPFTYLPYQLAYMVFNLLNVAGFLFALHTFKGNRLLFFTSYPFFFLIFYGQIDGIIIGALAWMYLALQREDWKQASLAWMLALTKVHIGLVLGVGLLWLHAPNLMRIRVVAAAAVMFLLSNLVWPLWILNWYIRMTGPPMGPNRVWSVDAWDITGPLVLLLWLPFIVSDRKNFRWFVATAVCTAPYWHTYSLTVLEVFPLGWPAWLFYIGYLDILPSLKLHSGPLYLAVPLWIYLTNVYPQITSLRLSDWLQAFQRNQSGEASGD